MLINPEIGMRVKTTPKYTGEAFEGVINRMIDDGRLNILIEVEINPHKGDILCADWLEFVESPQEKLQESPQEKFNLFRWFRKIFSIRIFKGGDK